MTELFRARAREWFRIPACFAITLLAYGGAGAGPVTVESGASAGGSSGLRVAVDAPACEGENHASVTGLVGEDRTVQACETVSAASATVAAGNRLGLLAGYRVSLGAGFGVQAGAEFSAAVDGQRVRGGFVRDDTPAGEPHYAARFHLRRDALTLGTDERLTLLQAEDRLGRAWVSLKLKYDGSDMRLYLVALDDGGGQSTTEGTGEVILPAGWRMVEVELKAAAPGAGDGFALIELEGAAGPGLNGLDNDQARVDTVLWGVLGALPASDGWLDLDEFVSRRAGRIGPTP